MTSPRWANHLNAAQVRRTLRQIHARLDGTEWEADTLNDIAEILLGAGLTIREPVVEADEDADLDARARIDAWLDFPRYRR